MAAVIPVLAQERFGLERARRMKASNLTFDVFGSVFAYLPGCIVVFVVIPLAFVGFLFFGFKDAGSVYYSPDGKAYTAGSLFHPDEYTSYQFGGLLEAADQSSADALNEQVAAARARNLPGLILSVVVFVAACVLLCYVVLAFFHGCGVAGQLAEPPALRAWLLAAWQAEKGTAYATRPLEDQYVLPFGLALYALGLAGRPGGAGQLAQAGAPAEALQQTQVFGTSLEGCVLRLFAGMRDGRPVSELVGSAASAAQGAVSTLRQAPGVAPQAAGQQQAAPFQATSATSQAAAPQPEAWQQTLSAQVQASVQPATVFCSACGAKVVASARFCPVCGARIGG